MQRFVDLKLKIARWTDANVLNVNEKKLSALIGLTATSIRGREASHNCSRVTLTN